MKLVSLLIVLVCFGGAYSASITCRLAAQRRWQVRWYLAPLAAAVSVLAGVICLLVASACLPGRSTGIAPQDFRNFIYGCLLAFASSLAPAALVVWFYRRRFGAIGPDIGHPSPQGNLVMANKMQMDQEMGAREGLHRQILRRKVTTVVAILVAGLTLILLVHRTANPYAGAPEDKSAAIRPLSDPMATTRIAEANQKIDEAVQFIREKSHSLDIYSDAKAVLDKRTGRMDLALYHKEGRLAHEWTLELSKMDASRITFGRIGAEFVLQLLDDNGNVKQDAKPTEGALLIFPTMDYARRTGLAFEFLMETFGGPPPDPAIMKTERELIRFIEKKGRKKYPNFQLQIQNPGGLAVLRAGVFEFPMMPERNGNRVFRFKLKDLDYDHCKIVEHPGVLSVELDIRTVNLKRAILLCWAGKLEQAEEINQIPLSFEQKDDAAKVLVALKRLGILYGWKNEAF